MGDGLQAALGVAAIVLAALLVGAMLPVLVAARGTLNETRRFVRDASRKLDATLAETSGLLGRVDRVVSQVEPRVQAVTDSLDEARKALNVVAAVGASVGPAVAAAVRAYQSARQEGQGGNGAGGTHGPAGTSAGG